MSYKAYFNGRLIDISTFKPIAYNKQVNDLAKLSNRQTNYTQTLIADYTDNNKAVFEGLAIVGTQTNLQYERNRFDLIDTISGKHLIYNGWAQILSTTPKGYELKVYDGIIDFYKAIENKKMTDVGISDLNHLKTVANIIDSWTTDLPYKYIIADYNGKVLTTDSKLNADYLIPSAKVSYLWDRVHSFAGFSYTGNTFNQERFTNLWLTFPKPVPTEEPVVTFIANDDSFFTSIFNEILGIYVYIPIYFPTNFDTALANNNTGQNEIFIEENGAYRLTCNGTLFFPTSQIGIVSWKSVNAINQVTSSGTINASLNQSVVITAVAGGRIILGDAFPYFTFWSGSIESTLEKIEGFTASFDEALIDLNIKDFVNEVMQHFGLTAFKDPYTNNIDYLALDEILQNTNVIDWSDKFTGKAKESYILNNYGQLNKYKYRYNEENQTHNDGSISIANENIKDEVTVLQSICYSPERQKRALLGLEMNVYRIWNREIKDDATVEYKDLTGRYYFMRVQNHNFVSEQTLKSEALGIEDTFTIAPIESFDRLPLQQVIFDNYSTIESIFNRARLLDTIFYLSAWDVHDFTFKQLIYVRQLAGYFQVNKIPNFIKGKETKVELVEVDYFTEIPIIVPIDYYINVLSIDELDCEITIEVETNLNVDFGLAIELIPYAYTWTVFGGYVLVPAGDPIPYTLFTSTIVTTITTLPPPVTGGYFFKVRHTTSVFEIIESGLSGEVNLTGCYIPPIEDLNYLNLISATTLSVVGNVRTIEIEYESDLSITDMGITLYYSAQVFYEAGTLFFPAKTQNGTLTIEVPNQFLGTNQIYNIQILALGIYSNIITS